MQRLFDDEFGGLALGTPWANSLAEENILLLKRSMSASSVFVCAIRTVTEGSIDDRTATTVEFQGPDTSQGGATTARCPKISIASNSYSYSILRQSGLSLVGKSVVMFIRNFNENGFLTWHWHAEPDRPNIRESILKFLGPLK
jgi:hypothetical protein